MPDEFIYIGLTGATLEDDEVDLGDGIALKRTYAHLMSPCLMAFSPAEPGKPHPAPWKAARGGYAFDVHLELRVPISTSLAGMDCEEIANWIIALLRLSHTPYVRASVSIDMPFSEAALPSSAPTITPMETEPLPFSRDLAPISSTEIEWVRNRWKGSAQLAANHRAFREAVFACDETRHHARRRTQTLLLIWGALEQLFSPSKQELRYRVATNIAAFLEPRGPRRRELFHQSLKLYDERSSAAHSVSEVTRESVVKSWLLLRNTLIKIVRDHEVPDKKIFEHLLFEDQSNGMSDVGSWGIAPTDRD